MINCCYLIESKKWKFEDREEGLDPSLCTGWFGNKEYFGFNSGKSEDEIQKWFNAMKKSQISWRLTKINEMTRELNQLNRLKLLQIIFIFLHEE